MYRAKRGIHSFYTLSFMQYVCVYTHADGCRFLSRSRRCALPSYRGGWRSHSSPRAAARGGGGGEKYPQPPSHPLPSTPPPLSLSPSVAVFSLCRCVEHAPLWALWFLFLNQLLSQKKQRGGSSKVKQSAASPSPCVTTFDLRSFTATRSTHTHARSTETRRDQTVHSHTATHESSGRGAR